MSKRIHLKSSNPYRPYMGSPYKAVFEKIAAELNKTSMLRFDDLAVARHAAYELWQRVFHDIPFPPDADVLRTQYHRDPGTKDTVQSA